MSEKLLQDQLFELGYKKGYEVAVHDSIEVVRKNDAVDNIHSELDRIDVLTTLIKDLKSLKVTNNE